MMMVTALSFRVYWFMREWGMYIAGWTGKQLVDSMVLAVCVVTEGWMDWQTTGWQYGTGSVCCDSWLNTGRHHRWNCELNCQINVDSALFVRLDVLLACVSHSALFVRLDVLLACVSHSSQPVLTQWTLVHVAAASSHTVDTYTCSCSQFSHTGHLHM